MDRNEQKPFLDRLHYTIVDGTYADVDEIVHVIKAKKNFLEWLDLLFEGCKINSDGELIPGGFFADGDSEYLEYAMVSFLSIAPLSFLLRERVRVIRFAKKPLKEAFKLPAYMDRLSRLESLVLAGLALKKLPEGTKVLSKLRRLNISYNHFTSFPDDIAYMKELRLLDISFNRIKVISDSIIKLKRLRLLKAVGNQIAAISPAIGKLEALHKIDLSMNQLESLPVSLNKIPNLSELRLRYNKFPAEIEYQWETMSLAGHPGRQMSFSF